MSTSRVVAAGAMNRAPTGLLLALLVVVCSVKAAPLTYDFETGNLQGWQIVEGSFGKLICDRPNFHHGNTPYNKQGTWFLTTLDTPDGHPSDRYTGVVESPVFKLTGPTITLLVGGGKHRETFIALCTLDGKRQLEARGGNTQTMAVNTWDASRLVGQLVYVQVVDARQDGWGHITLDDLQAEGVIDPDATAKHLATRQKVLDQLALEGFPSPGDPDTLRAAILDLKGSFGADYPLADEYLARLAQAKPGSDAFRLLQREALLANPLLTRQPVLFVSRPQYLKDHHNTATIFQVGEINQRSFRGGGALCLLDVRSGRVTTLVDVPEGIARDPEISFDGRRILFSMRRNADDDYHLYEVDADGSDLRQLTSAPGVSDLDPLYLADDSIAFSATREPKYCMCNRHIMANLFRCEPDGANILQIGRSTLFEGHGALLPDGRILYDRWEYVDRNFGDAQGLWTVNPDGTNHAVYWGNNTGSPGGVIDARSVPGTEQVVCTFTSCHDRPWGAIALLDRRLGLDNRDGVVRTWPADAIERVGQGGFDSYVSLLPKYEDPYPLSERYYLCSRMTGSGEEMALFLLDVFGNQVLLHKDGRGCYDPMPLAPRPRPIAIPSRREYDDSPGTCYVLDVYDGTDLQGVKRGDVKWLRVVESPPKLTWSPAGWNGQGQEAPAMNWHDFNNKRILGEVPVEPDGSAYFEVPSDRFVFFQLLDADHRMVQSMRSGTMVQAGERAGCVGCHEPRRSTPAPGMTLPQAMQRPASPVDDAAPLFNYRAEIQPILDRSCVSCHDFGQPGGGLVLSGDRDLTFCASYIELWQKKLIKAVGAGPSTIQPAGSWGSRASRLMQVLDADHHGVKLSADEVRRIATWIDLNAPYYPSYACAHPTNLAGRAPLTNQQLDRLSELVGLPFSKLAGHSTSQGPQVSFDRPRLSPCLAQFKDRSDPQYVEALALIEAGATELQAHPEADDPGFVPCEEDRRKAARYAAREAAEARCRAARRTGEKVYDR